MSRGRPKKCLICNESILDGNSVPYKGRYAHSKCFNIAVKTLQKDKTEKITKAEEKKKLKKIAKPKAELKDGMSEEAYKQKLDYYNYIRKIIGNDDLDTKIYALSESYIKKYGFTFSTMLQTLMYLHEIVEKEITGDVVGIIPYYYSTAMAYYDGVLKIKELNKDIDASGMYKQQIIRINVKKRDVKQIDIESI